MTTQYKILVNDRQYEDWNLFDALSLNEIEKLSINPVSNKLFSSDIFEINKDKIYILHSSVRCMPSIPGILVLKGNKTYGKMKDKFLYKCIPDDRRFPEFVVPYNVKLGFSKNTDNKYIVFKYNNWNGKHPQGTIVSVLGDVDVLCNFYEYQLYCKSLYASIQEFNKVVSNKLKKKTAPEFISSMISKYNLKDRSDEPVYSIDSKETTDYDDAFSIIDLGNNSYKISIYISNVPLWMEELDLWNSFSERISTIYLPDRKRPMMPLALSNCVCSLCEQETRLAFGIDITVKDNEIIGYCLDNSYIKVYKNHVYESKELKQDLNYKLMFKVVTELSKDYKYLKKINDSHDMVAYLMILMNYYTSRDMVKYNNGIYRSVSFNKDYKMDDTLPDNVNNFLKIWNSSCGQYDLYDERKCHEMLDLESYIHCTSPIRRLVDLLNMAKLQKNMKMVNYGENFVLFYDKWTSRLEYINTTMRAIRKIQTDCSLLHLCSTDSEVLEREYDGYVFDKIIRNDGLFQYIVYLENLKSVSRITSRFDLNNFEKYKFRVFVFHEEATLKKKIRLHIIL
jgi:exoribonuclease R|uniref:RNB domain-containing protein n=1 Tax=viral metagenome TaxID=1070528 RepID=A0A6C0CJS1_9ZZZZ